MSIDYDKMGCRLATASQYYRSIYSTVAQDATACSSTVAGPHLSVFSAMVEQNRTESGRFPVRDSMVQ
jgi:hypothetical protein